MTAVDETKHESRAFEADVAKLLHMMVHSVYSDKDIFLRELISNAADACERLRYEAIANPELLGDDPTPRITLIIDADKRSLTVEDNGIGIAPDAHEAIFEMFQRLNSSTAYEGTGIGLAIVRKAAERMGGRVGVESTLGSGSRFWLELPKA